MKKVMFTAESYYVAASDHLRDTGLLIEAEQYQWAHYLAGLAVECILRAYGKDDEEFVARHDLIDLTKKSGYLLLSRDEKYNSYKADLLEANLRWRSNQRFMAEKQLENYLNSLQLDQGIKGSRVKYSSRQMYFIAERIVGLGVVKWNSRNK